VHVAYLNDGRKVAVKFLYPRIREIVAVDMRVVRLAMRAYRWFVPVTKLERVHESLVDLLRRETDYLHEAACMERMAKNFAGEPHMSFPEPVHELTTKDVLVMTFMNGTKITKLDELTRPGRPDDEVAVRLIQSFYKMLFVDRFFHADPHPGNFLVEKQTDGGFRVVVLDFGAICEAKRGPHRRPARVRAGRLHGATTSSRCAASSRWASSPRAGTASSSRRRRRPISASSSRSRTARPPRSCAAPRGPAEAGGPRGRAERAAGADALGRVPGGLVLRRARVRDDVLALRADRPDLDTMAAGMPYVMPLVMAKQAAKAATPTPAPAA
jgi:ubiquinone biosynthesis protein